MSHSSSSSINPCQLINDYYMQFEEVRKRSSNKGFHWNFLSKGDSIDVFCNLPSKEKFFEDPNYSVTIFGNGVMFNVKSEVIKFSSRGILSTNEVEFRLPKPDPKNNQIPKSWIEVIINSL